MQLTHIEAQKRKQLHLKLAVCAILNWTEEQYTWFLFRQGLRYMFIYFGNDAAGIAFQEKRKIFWNWWRGQWYIREEAFVQNFQQHYPQDQTLKEYKLVHNAAILASEIYPDASLLGERFEMQTDILQFLKTPELY